MVKFEGSNATDIEICGSANKPLPLLLNRQTIKILEDLGVPHDTFLKLQTKAIEALRKATLSIEDASSFLEDNRIGGAARLPWLFRRLQGLKLSFRSDDLLRKVLEISVLSRLREIKYKARIPVEEGWNLYGKPPGRVLAINLSIAALHRDHGRNKHAGGWGGLLLHS